MVTQFLHEFDSGVDETEKKIILTNEKNKQYFYSREIGYGRRWFQHFRHLESTGQDLLRRAVITLSRKHQFTGIFAIRMEKLPEFWTKSVRKKNLANNILIALDDLVDLWRRNPGWGSSRDLRERNHQANFQVVQLLSNRRWFPKHSQRGRTGRWIFQRELRNLRTKIIYIFKKNLA